MTVYYMDDFSIVGVDIDFPVVNFLNGEAYFLSNGEEYRINIKNLIDIVGN